MKRKIVLITVLSVVFAFVLTIVGIFLFNYFFNNGLIYEYAGDEAYVTGWEDWEEEMEIPQFVEKDGKEYKVTKIVSFKGYDNNHNIKKITIPSTIREISDNCFANFNKLEEIIIPDDSELQIIGNNAFENCNKLKNFNFTKEIKLIGKDAFNCCSSFENILLNDGLLEIRDNAFFYCSSLSSISLPISLEKIGECAFVGTKINELYIPENVNSISNEIIGGINTIDGGRCSNVEKIVVAENNKFYDSRNNCNAIIETSTNTLISTCKNTVIPDGVEIIGSYAFKLTGMKNINIPNSVKKIESNAIFENNLDYLFIPSTVEMIEYNGIEVGPYLFCITNMKYEQCKWDIEFCRLNNFNQNSSCNCMLWNLEEDKIYTESGFIYKLDGKNATVLGYIGKNKVIEIPSTINVNNQEYNVTQISSIINDNVEELTINNGITEVGMIMSYNLKNISLPSSVQSVEKDLICYNNSILFNYNTFENVNYVGNNENPYLILVDAPENIETYNVHENTKIIADGAFYNCEKLKDINIPIGVTSIGDGAFYNCEKLKDINIPSGVTSIGDKAFKGCRLLTNVEIPNSVTSIGNNAFEGCQSLTNVTIPNGVINIGESAFSWCDSLTNVEIPNSVTSIGKKCFSFSYNIKGTNYNDGIYLGNSENPYIYLLDVTYGTEYLNINANTKFINIEIFSDGFLQLRNINIDSSNQYFKTIDGHLYSKDETILYACSNKIIDKYFEVPKNVKYIEDYAFKRCYNLEEVILPEGLLSIGRSSFSGGSITNIILPKSLKSIGDHAFFYNSYLKTVIIFENVEYIGTYAFEGNINIYCEVLRKPKSWADSWHQYCIVSYGYIEDK